MKTKKIVNIFEVILSRYLCHTFDLILLPLMVSENGIYGLQRRAMDKQHTYKRLILLLNHLFIPQARQNATWIYFHH